MSIQITTAKQKVEFSKMVKDYKIRYYNLGPNVLYVDYIDSTGTRTEAVPAYSSFIVMSNAGNAANSYLNLYTSSGTTNIVVSKIQQDCAVDGTDLFGNVITAVDPADVASLLQKTVNMTASSGTTNFTGITNLASASVSGALLANGGFIYTKSGKTWSLRADGLSEGSSSSADKMFSVQNGNVDCETLTAATQIYIPNVISFTSDAGNNLFSRLNMSTKSDDAEVVKWYLDASDGIKFVEGQGGTGLQIGASGISMPSCFKLMLGTEASNGGVVFYGPERIRLESGVLFGPRTGLYSIDADGNATLANCTANTISANGYIHGTVFKGTASGSYFEISPGVCKLPSGNPASGIYGYSHWVGTQSDYDKIVEKDIHTLYYVIQADNSVNIIKGPS